MPCIIGHYGDGMLDAAAAGRYDDDDGDLPVR